jgi:hypothetical protein
VSVLLVMMLPRLASLKGSGVPSTTDGAEERAKKAMAEMKRVIIERNIFGWLVDLVLGG